MRYDYHEFSTDVRNYPDKNKSARQWSYVVVDLCATEPLVKKMHGIGLSHGYRLAYDKTKDTLVEIEEVARAERKRHERRC